MSLISRVPYTAMDGKKLIIFDKDGTLMDSSPGSFATFQAMAEQNNLQAEPRSRWPESLCGPFSRNIKWLFHLDDKQILPMIMEYVRIYGENEGYYDFIEYPGICETVRELAGRYMLSVATMMYIEFAIKSFQAMDIDGCFLTIQGAVLDRYVSKQEMLSACMEIAGVTPEETVFVGDCIDDLESAKEAGIDFVGVTYGYGFRPEDCEKLGIPYARTPAELLDIL